MYILNFKIFLFILALFCFSSFGYSQHSLKINAGLYGNTIPDENVWPITFNDSVRVFESSNTQFSPILEINYSYTFYDKVSLGTGIILTAKGQESDYQVIFRDPAIAEERFSSISKTMIFPFYIKLDFVPYVQPLIGISWVRNSNLRISDANDQFFVNKITQIVHNDYKRNIYTYDFGLSHSYGRFHAKVMYRKSFGHSEEFTIERSKYRYYYPRFYNFLMLEFGYEIFKSRDKD